MNFLEKIEDAIRIFKINNLEIPNEIWFGYKEIMELHNTFGGYYPDKYSKIEVKNLKIRQEDTDSMFIIKHNQYYEKV